MILDFWLTKYFSILFQKTYLVGLAQCDLTITTVDSNLWQYRLWNFQTGDTKLERFLPKNQHTQRELLNFEFWINSELSKGAKIWLSKSSINLSLSQFFYIAI